MTRRGDRLPGLTGLRAPTALAVVLVHAEWFVAGGDSVVYRSVAFLNAAVTLFFVLSGFVLTWGQAGTPAYEFYLRRVARLVPVHLLTALIAAVVIYTTALPAPTARQAVESLLLINCWTSGPSSCIGVNQVSWSLSVEALFYAVFPVVSALGLWRSRPGRTSALVLSLAWVLVGVKVNMDFRGADQWALLRLGEFGIGMWLAASVKRGWRPGMILRILAVAGGLAWLVTTARYVTGQIQPPALQVTDLWAMPACALLVASVAARDVAGRPGVLARRPALVLGGWSYSLFMSHYPFILLMGALLDIDRGWLQQLTVAILVAGSVPLAWLVYRAVEKPAEARLRRVFGVAARATEDHPPLAGASGSSRPPTRRTATADRD